jgi:Ca-activated chloride channel family protein
MTACSLVLLLALGQARAETAIGPLAGRPLGDALRLLQERGLPVIFSSELVLPQMRVTSEPKATRPEEALVEILRPHGLAARPGPGGRLLVVRAPSPASPDEDPRVQKLPSFGSEIRIVRLDITVVRRDGRFVTDIASKDLEIFEDGVLQAADTVTFIRREMPVSLVLLLDASASMSDRLSLAQAAATGFLERLQPEDQASVVEFNVATNVLQEMTGDRAALRQAVERIDARGPTALYNALYATLMRVPKPQREAEVRRRAVVLLSDGEDTASLVWEEQVLELARRREATVHVIALSARGTSNRSAGFLELLSRESGGEIHRPESVGDLANVYARIGEELRSQYTIGYQSSSAQDGRWRRIQVRVRGRRDLQVRHRLGYYAAP